MSLLLSSWLAVSTAYCGYSGHLTASGTVPRPGVLAAPREVPFGTQLWVDGYGLGVVEDRGGAIFGNRLDLYFISCHDAIQWGRRTVAVSPYVPVSLSLDPQEERE